MSRNYRNATAIITATLLVLALGDPASANSLDTLPSSPAEKALDDYDDTSTSNIAFEDTDIHVSTEKPEIKLPASPSGPVLVGLPTTNAPVESHFAPDMRFSELPAGGKLALEAVPSPESASLSDGLRALIAIADASSPTSFDFHVTLPEGHRLALVEGGGAQASDPGTGAVSLIVPRPWAVDSDGKDVPTKYLVDGNTPTQVIETGSDTAFPVIADPLWFVPLIIAGGRVIGQVAIRAATRSAAAARASAIAAARIVRTVRGKIAQPAFRRCGLGAAIGTGAGIAASPPVTLKQRGDGKWHVSVGSWAGTVSSAVGGCLSANIR
ncbi:hypothetical protein [Okibacterium fritillariae]|uniref:Uncharacterized protein n=1 Tax=Okibacterium fritillariae TaxID=123320 RepID=A0A1T5IRJ1_9MICO|nr:hypothetical protein [Okibacterium fritillariae]SKC41735.1 hypothetical protein SAMN06309945_0775 [Okibacterium fritillariae]